jgi:hypothetical protein
MPTCTATKRETVRYGYPPEFVTIPCERADLDDQGRHRGQHHGWQDMPAGERSIRVPDPAKPGWTIEGTEKYDAWRRLWTWNEGGAAGTNRRETNPTACPSCGTLSYPESSVPSEAVLYTGSPDAYAVAGQPNPVECYHCRLWAERITAFTAGWQRRGPRDHRLTRLIRLRNDDGTASPRLNSWADGVTGAFGDRKVTVRWDDGDQRGPQSSMWDGGAIPWWLDDQFPTNAVLLDRHPSEVIPVNFGDPL